MRTKLRIFAVKSECSAVALHLNKAHHIFAIQPKKRCSMCQDDQAGLGCKMLIMEWLRLSPGRRLESKAEARRKAGNI